MKNNCHFITAKFNRYDVFSNLNQKCYRIITNKETYYFFEHQFVDITVLDKLSEGDIIHIGSHALDDGTYWLHWLVSLKGELAIRHKLHYAIPSIYILILPIAIFICFLLDVEFIGFLLFIALSMTIVWCLCATLFRLVNLFLPKQIFLRHQFYKMKRGDIKFMQTSVYENRQPLYCPVSNLPVYEGYADNINSSYYHERQIVSFDFNGVRLLFKEYAYSLSNFVIPVIYYSNHPTFIAAEDKLSLIFENNKIQGLINHSDGASYLFCHCLWMSRKKAKILLCYFYTLLIPASLLSIVFYPWFFAVIPFCSFLLITLALQILPLIFLLFYTLFSLLNGRTYTKLVLRWLNQTTGKWPKEI